MISSTPDETWRKVMIGGRASQMFMTMTNWCFTSAVNLTFVGDTENHRNSLQFFK